MDFLPAVRRRTSNDDLRRNTSCLHQCFDNRECRIVTTIENEDNFVSVVILREQRAKVFFEPGLEPSARHDHRSKRLKIRKRTASFTPHVGCVTKPTN